MRSDRPITTSTPLPQPAQHPLCTCEMKPKTLNSSMFTLHNIEHPMQHISQSPVLRSSHYRSSTSTLVYLGNRNLAAHIAQSCSLIVRKYCKSLKVVKVWKKAEVKRASPEVGARRSPRLCIDRRRTRVGWKTMWMKGSDICGEELRQRGATYILCTPALWPWKSSSETLLSSWAHCRAAECNKM